MPHAIQSASLSFGLVNIPVRLYPATSSKSVSFHLLHKTDGSRVRQQFYCPADKKTVSRADLIKGYEVKKNEYVELSDEELKAMEEAANRSVDILEFVPLEAIDPVYFEKTYYLGPDKGGEKSYRLFAAAMHKQNRVAIAKFVMRGKENLVLIRPTSDGTRLILDVLYYADEVRNIHDIESPVAKIRDQEIGLAERLIDELSNEKWQADKYRDTYRERILELIKKKQQGEEVVIPPAAEKGAEVVDLMDALKRSLGQGRPAKPKRRATAVQRARGRPTVGQRKSA
jgi:DNA end-binding protein Ku